MATCKECLHNGVCSLWRAAEGQDASNYTAGGGCREFLDQARFAEVPCKYGDTVWCVSKTKVVEATAFSTTVYKDELEVDLEFQCDTDCDNCPFADWSQSYCGEWSCSGEYGETMVKASDFGKWIFLTREEAEEALKKMQEERTDGGVYELLT